MFKISKPKPVQKVWGWTRCVYLGHNAEAHYLEIDEGGFCSRHQHRNKWNQFFVIKGELAVVFFDVHGVEQERFVLRDGDTLDVPPGHWHRFEAITAVTCTETYWNEYIDPLDIERRDQGGNYLKPR